MEFTFKDERLGLPSLLCTQSWVHQSCPWMAAVCVHMFWGSLKGVTMRVGDDGPFLPFRVSRGCWAGAAGRIPAGLLVSVVTFSFCLLGRWHPL